jgi:hypothetical protein
LLTFCILAVILWASISQAAWYHSSWEYRKSITVDPAKVPSDQTDFPVLVSVADDADLLAHAQPDGDDILFTTSDGLSKLSHEIESYDGASGTLVAWVKVPALSGSYSTEIYLYYGNSSAVSQEDGGNVWISEYSGVWHLDEEQAGTGNEGVYLDSSLQLNHGSDHIAATGQEGKIGRGQQFSGDGDYIGIPHDTSLNLTGPMTLSYWVKLSADAGQWNRVIEKGNGGFTTGYYFGGGDGTNDVTFYLTDTEVFDTADYALTTGNWHHVAVTYASNGDATFILDGTATPSGNFSGTVVGNTDSLYVANPNPTWDTAGYLDEIRIAGADLGVDWVITEYNNQSEPANFYSLGPAENLFQISGIVFEDIVGDVLADGVVGDANNPGVEGVDVYLYLDDGDANLDAGDTLVGGAPTPTDASGNYSFSGLSDGDYFVVVDSKTVASTQDPAAVLTDIWAEQTYGPAGGYYDNGIGFGIRVTAGPCYGGIAGHLSDDFSQWDDREHRAIVTVGGSDAANVDFGFSFNVVTNLVGGDTRDDDVGTNRTVQGSLRQFIQNANAINTANVMRFVPVESPGAVDGFGNQWWRLPVTVALPAITGDGTTIDGRAFDFTDGTTPLDPNTAQTGAGLAVGTEGSFTTPQLDPELEIWNMRATAVVPTGLVFEANDSVLRHVSIWGFGDAAGTFDTNVRFGTNYGVTPDFTGSLAEFNVFGTGPASFTEPGASDLSGQKNLTLRETDGAIVRDNLIGFAGGSGVDFNSASSSGVVLRNEIRRNGILNPSGNPVGVWISGNVTGNLITDNASGIYSGPTLGITYQDNTITANGWGGTRPDGIRASGSSELIQRNVIADNAGGGVVVPSTTNSIQMSRNSFHGNGTSGGQIGIDLLGSGDDPSGGPFVTINDNLDLDSGGNDLLNFPIIDAAEIQGPDLVVSGWARPGSLIEFYLADPDPAGFGEGKTWLITQTEGSADDTDATTGLYGPGPINGIAQGTDDTNLFSFTIPLTSLAAPVGPNDAITATAYLSGNTSEFSGNAVVSSPNYALGGTVFEDADFAGTASPYDGGANDLPLANVDVELYDGVDAYLASTTTAGDGSFSFTGLSAGDYKVRVRSATIGDADTPPAGGFNTDVPAVWPYPLAEMTWGYGSALMGGQDPVVDDSSTADDAGPGDTYVMVTISGADVTDVNFGFNFELIVNSDDDANPNNVRSKQGTLRQFIKNSNSILGINKSWFQIPGI